MNSKEVAERVGVTPATLKRWVDTGVIPEPLDGDDWPPSAVAHARIVARLRERGHSLQEIREAAQEGKLASGLLEDLFPDQDGSLSVDDVAEQTGLEAALIERIWSSVGFPIKELDDLTDDDVQALRYIASVLDAGFPLVAFLQLVRVYGQALSQIADAEVRLFHLYVHEPLMRDGVPGLQMAEEMENLARDLLPLASPIMDYIHQRFLQHFVEQDVVGHMEVELSEQEDLGRVRVAIAFADLAGYTRFTEEAGEEEAFSTVERFIDAVQNTLPDDARIIKTIGDEVMIVGQDVRALTDWAVGFQRLYRERPTPRIGVHQGVTLYRDGDYFGRDVNLAARVVARARGGEVLVTDAVTGQVGRLRPPRVRGHRRGQAEGLRPAGDALPRAAEGGLTRALEAARASGLVRAGEPLLVMVSGGADSVCLLDVARRARAPTCRALHVNYGLREGADGDEELVRGAVRVARGAAARRARRRSGAGNLQAEARERRYALAERHADGRLRRRPHGVRPGRDRALPAGRVAGAARAAGHGAAARAAGAAAARGDPRRHRAWCRARGLEWREDPSNADRALRARARAPRRAGGAARAEPGGRAEHRADRGAAARRGRRAARRWPTSA